MQGYPGPQRVRWVSSPEQLHISTLYLKQVIWTKSNPFYQPLVILDDFPCFDDHVYFKLWLQRAPFSRIINSRRKVLPILFSTRYSDSFWNTKCWAVRSWFMFRFQKKKMAEILVFLYFLCTSQKTHILPHYRS